MLSENEASLHDLLSDCFGLLICRSERREASPITPPVAEDQSEIDNIAVVLLALIQITC